MLSLCARFWMMKSCLSALKICRFLALRVRKWVSQAFGSKVSLGSLMWKCVRLLVRLVVGMLLTLSAALQIGALLVWMTLKVVIGLCCLWACILNLSMRALLVVTQVGALVLRLPTCVFVRSNLMFVSALDDLPGVSFVLWVTCCLRVVRQLRAMLQMLLVVWTWLRLSYIVRWYSPRIRHTSREMSSSALLFLRQLLT